MNRRRFLNSCAAVTGGLLSAGGLMSLRADEPVRIVSNAAAIEASKLGPAIKIARSSLEKLSELKDYEATFIKKERFGRKVIETPIRVKVRHEPFSVYMHFGKPHEGREVIFVAGKNDGRLLAHETGLKSIVGTLSLETDSRRAMEGNHYPITRFGMFNILESVIEQWEHDALLPGADVAFYPKATVGNAACKAIETKFLSHVQGASFQTTRLYLDAETGFPVRVQQYNFPRRSGRQPELHEEYTFLSIKTNVGLTNADFDINNPEYDF